MTTVNKASLTSIVKEGNRIAIPAILLRSMDLKVGDPITVVVEDGLITVSKCDAPSK